MQSVFIFGGNMDLNDIKDKAENVYGGENTTEYKEFEDKFKPKKTTDDC